jgi:uncharacterized protein
MTAQKIMVHQAADPLVILTACYFHDIVSLPKNHPERSQSSRWRAQNARHSAPRFPGLSARAYAAVARD